MPLSKLVNDSSTHCNQTGTILIFHHSLINETRTGREGETPSRRRRRLGVGRIKRISFPPSRKRQRERETLVFAFGLREISPSQHFHEISFAPPLLSLSSRSSRSFPSRSSNPSPFAIYLQKQRWRKRERINEEDKEGSVLSLSPRFPDTGSAEKEKEKEEESEVHVRSGEPLVRRR